MKLLQEFKAFAFKGSMIDLAIAVVIGAAFSNVIKSLVDNVIMPAISYITPGKMAYTEWKVGMAGKSMILYGKFLGDVLNFLIIAFAIFLVLVKVVGMISKMGAREPEPGEPTTKECPFCLSVIPIKATKCAHCATDLPGPAATAQP